MEKYLPIGSVVTLKNGKKKLMIYGRRQIQTGTETEWDYVACLYPEGNINEKYVFLFNHEKVDKVFHLGYRDEEEQEFIKRLSMNNPEKTKISIKDEDRFL